ncbi:MAG: hypothetical protein AAGJ35_12655 [Myxococcota bacterium]
MQISIQVPDSLPLFYIQQRIQEFEKSLQADAANQQQPHNIKNLLLAIPAVGNDQDFERNKDDGRPTNALFD